MVWMGKKKEKKEALTHQYLVRYQNMEEVTRMMRKHQASVEGRVLRVCLSSALTTPFVMETPSMP